MRRKAYDASAKYHYIGRAPGFEHTPPSVTSVVNSDQATLRHTKRFAYRCFLPDLTGFTSFRCAGPNLHRHLLKPDLTEIFLCPGIPPRYSGLRVQGTATSPSSTTKLLTNYNNCASFIITDLSCTKQTIVFTNLFFLNLDYQCTAINLHVFSK